MQRHRTPACAAVLASGSLLLARCVGGSLQAACYVAAALLLAGCAAGPDFTRPAAPADTRYTHDAQPAATAIAGGQAQQFLSGAELPADWWRLFRSPALDAVVQQALAANPTLQAARANLRVSQDRLRAGSGVFYPQVGAALGAQRARSAPLEQGSTLPGMVFNVATASGGIDYALDLFGGERRAVEGLQAQVDSQRWAVQAAYLALTANVVNTCIARAAYIAQERATEAVIALETEQLHALEGQVRAGTAAYASVLAQRSLIAADQALLAPLQQKVSQATHLLALLQGLRPAEADAPEIDFDTLALPRDLPRSLPSELVHRRPDILASEAQLHAASAAIGVATAALYPGLNLDASFGVAGPTPGSLGGAGGRFWSIGPSLGGPLFHGGSLQAQRQAAQDAYDAQLANYRQTVLTAFDQVADALKALEHDARALQAQLDAQHQAAEALALQQAQWRAGLAACVDVLTAEVQWHQARIAALAAQAQRQQDTVALFAALGGGWWSAPGAPADAEGRTP